MNITMCDIVGRSFRLLAVLAIGILLTAFGVFHTPIRAATEIEVACFQGGYGIDFFEECAREYEKAHPDVKINLWGNPRVWDQLLPRFAAGTPPDLCWPGWGMNTWKLIFNGQLMPLDKYLEQPALGDTSKKWGETFVPSLLQKGEYEGKRYLLPYNFDVFGWWYNKGLFDKHGWTPPTTYEELLVLCEKIKKEDVYPVTFTGRYPDYALRGFYYPWVISLGGLDAFKGMLRLDEGAWRDPAFIAAAHRVLEMKHKNNFQPGCIGMNHTESQMEFLVGRVAMIPCGSWLHAEMKKLLPKEFEMRFMLCPVFKDGKGDPSLVSAGIDGKGWCIPTKSKNPDVAADFFRFVSSAEKAKKFVETKGTLMSIRGLGDINAPPHLETPLKLVDQASSTWSHDVKDWYPEYATLQEKAFRDLYNEILSPSDFIESMEAAAARERNNPNQPKFKVP